MAIAAAARHYASDTIKSPRSRADRADHHERRQHGDDGGDAHDDGGARPVEARPHGDFRRAGRLVLRRAAVREARVPPPRAALVVPAVRVQAHAVLRHLRRVAGRRRRRAAIGAALDGADRLIGVARLALDFAGPGRTGTERVNELLVEAGSSRPPPWSWWACCCRSKPLDVRRYRWALDHRDDERVLAAERYADGAAAAHCARSPSGARCGSPRTGSRIIAREPRVQRSTGGMSSSFGRRRWWLALVKLRREERAGTTLPSWTRTMLCVRSTPTSSIQLNPAAGAAPACAARSARTTPSAASRRWEVDKDLGPLDASGPTAGTP